MTPETELKEFLRKPKNDTEPPTLPPHLGNLPNATYVTAALEYLDDYPFDRPFIMSTGWAVDPNAPNYQGWDEKARSYLRACVEVDRTGLASIDPTYDADLAQKQFLHEGIFKQRWTLEELASEIIALVELIRRETRTSSTVAMPKTTGKGIDDRVVDKVRLRDENCRLTGIFRSKKRTAEEHMRFTTLAVPTAALEVAHGLPFKMGDASFELVEVLTGLPWRRCDTVDCVENALLMQAYLHKLFGAFRIYLESDSNNDVQCLPCLEAVIDFITQIYIRARMSPGNANPTSELMAIINDELRLCHLPSALIDTRLRSPNLQTIPDIDMKFFTLHRFIGDIAWMCGGGPEFDDEDGDGEDVRVLSADNWLVLQEKLTSNLR